MRIIERTEISDDTNQEIINNLLSAINNLKIEYIKLDTEESYNVIIDSYRKIASKRQLRIITNRDLHILIQTQKMSDWKDTPKYCTLQLFGYLNILLFDQYWGLLKPPIADLMNMILSTISNFYNINEFHSNYEPYTFELEYTTPTIAWVISTSTRKLEIDFRVNTLLLNNLYIQSEINLAKEFEGKVKNIGAYLYFISDYELLKIEYELGSQIASYQEVQSFVQNNIEIFYDSSFKFVKEDNVLFAKTSYTKFGNCISFDFGQGLSKVSYFGLIKKSGIQFTLVYSYNDMETSNQISDVLANYSLFKPFI